MSRGPENYKMFTAQNSIILLVKNYNKVYPYPLIMKVSRMQMQPNLFARLFPNKRITCA